MKIYTKSGDAGETSLFDGTRVSKADARVDAYGELDELSACLGYVRSTEPDPDLDAALLHLQRDLFAISAQLADPSHKIAPRVDKAIIGVDDVTRLEHLIDRLETELPALTRFILAGGGQTGAALHVARAVCRRAERRVVTLVPPPDATVLQYLNRLSDLLFVMARVSNHRQGRSETPW